MRRLMHLAAGIAALSLPVAVAAQQPIVYPAKGQTPAQQNRDDGECYVWARQSTGIDPAVVAQTPATAQPTDSGGTVARGLFGGALAGAAIGGIAGDAGEGAAIGAVLGTMAGGRQARQNQAASQQQAQAQQQQKIDTFYRAYGACMEGRGYTIR